MQSDSTMLPSIHHPARNCYTYFVADPYKFVVLGINEGRADDPSQNPHANDDGKVTLEEAFDYANHVQVSGTQGSKPGMVDPDRIKDVYLSR